MSAPNLPGEVVTMLASREMREHHATWHLVRFRWNRLSLAEQATFRNRGWKPPRLVNQPGAGIDFLFMHRQMIKRVNEILQQLGAPDYPRVEGWQPIPWNHNDNDWPMPPIYPDGNSEAKEQATTDFWQNEVNNKYENNNWLRTISVDQLGSDIENGIHNWLHLHWASEPWFKRLPGQDRNDPKNDYLGSTYSSHVNKAFWKLHGWIDDRIGQWETANNTSANLSAGWDGPSHIHHMFTKSVFGEKALITEEQIKFSENFFVNLIEEDIK